MRNPTTHTGVDQTQAEYWAGGITRAEAQKIFDEYGATIMLMKQAMLGADMSIAYLFHKLGITPEEAGEWVRQQQPQEKPPA